MGVVLSHGRLIGGPEIAAFEEAWARYCGASFCVAVDSGTNALIVSLLSLELPHGSVVLTTPNTFIATAEAALFCGFKIAFVDVEADTGLVDLDAAEAYIERERVDVFLPVHMYGHPLHMERIAAIKARHGVRILADACQAHGASPVWRDGTKRPIGDGADLTVFSFYPAKNLGALGDAGAIITNDQDLYERCRCVRSHGESSRYVHNVLGLTARMDSIQAAALLVKLARLNKWNARRIDIASTYDRYFRDKTLRSDKYGLPSRHIYPLLLSNRDEVKGSLAERGIECGCHYPIPIHLSRSLAKHHRPSRRFPTTEQISNKELSLPIHPLLRDDEVMSVIDALRSVTDTVIP
ncbi:MAG: DegT/DnrJ/EryC1/StrS family aminotransferase [Thermaerobacter sp.]|nr:DegT/DnrJ/EryC1/StrS family aminotransferase [Thermaerobacter sp.]